MDENGKMHNIGTFMLDETGAPEFVQPGESTTQRKPTKANLKQAAKEIDEESGAATDYIPFNETSPKSKEARARAQETLDKKNREAKAKKQGQTPTPDKKQAQGIVSSQARDETKMVNGKKMTRLEFYTVMGKKYPGQVAEIEETWNSIK